MKKQPNTKIGLGSVVKSKAGELYNITREGRTIRMSKDVVGCVQIFLVNNNFLSQFKDGQNKEISSSLPLFLSSR